jgi:ABC-2 type transport system permease protein
VLVLAAAAFAVAVLAYRANAVRDLEQGFFPGRPGAARGGAFLSFHLGIVWRLHHGTLIAWAIGMFVAGAALGGMLGQAEYFADGELMQQLLPPAAGFSATELFTMFFNVLLAIAAIAPVIMFVFKARTEEQAGRTENVIAAGVCRVRYLAAHAALAFDTALIIPLATAAGMALTAHFTMYDPIRFGTLARALLVYVPALWVVLGLAVFIVGAAPRMAGVVWAFFGYVFLAGLFGDLFSLPSWALRISPLGWVPRLPLDEINYAALTGLSAVAALLTIAGLIAFRRRDIKI